MFFKLFLLLAILTKLLTAFVAEQDYYKHYDDYDDYEYDDAALDEAAIKSTDGRTTVSEATSKTDISGVTDDRTKAKRLRHFHVKAENKDDNDDVTYILTDRPTNSYEVTEIVDDIPNPVTFKPIVTNFTIKLPLNNASVINNNSNENNKNNKGRKNSISIFHVNAEFDDDKDKKPTIQNINIHKIPFGFSNLKDHVNKIKDDTLNYVHSTEVNEDPDEHYLPNILSAPRHFLRRLREKGSALYHKFF